MNDLPRIVVLLLCSIFFAGTASVHAAAHANKGSGSATTQQFLTGSVRSAAGKPMTGATVSAKLSGSPLTISVYTDKEGKYYFPPLRQPGKYLVWAQAVGYARSQMGFTSSKGIQKADFTLSPVEDYWVQLSGWQQIALMPEGTREERRGKALFTRGCTQCHQSSIAMALRFDEKGWTNIVDKMGSFFARSPLPVFHGQYRTELVSYLTKVSGPGPRPFKLKPPPGPGDEALTAAIYEYEIPSGAGLYNLNNGSDWMQGPARTSGVGILMHDATADLDGNVWFSNFWPIPGRTIARCNSETGEMTAYDYKVEDGKTGRAHGMFTARDGTIWFTLAFGGDVLTAHLGFMDPKTGEQRYYKVPEGMDAVGGWLHEDGKGGIWTSAGSYKFGAGALRFDRQTGKFEQYKSLRTGMTYGVTGDREGNGWWAQINDDTIGYVNRSTGEVGAIRLPISRGSVPYVTQQDMTDKELLETGVGIGAVTGMTQAPRRMVADLNGSYVWVANWGSSSLMRIDTRTRETKIYPSPYPGMMFYDVGVDIEHRVWVAVQNGDDILSFDPQTEKYTLYPIPTKGVGTRNLNVVERDNETQVVLAANGSGKAIKLVPRTAEELMNLKRAMAPVRQASASH